MNKKIILFFVLISLVINYELENDVLILHDSDFPQVLQQFETIFVEFYAPWCGHCKNLAPIYDEAATELKNKGSSIRLAKVDATIETSVAEQYQIKGFPTLIFFIKGQRILFKGSRSKEGIIRWLENKLKPAVGNVNTISELQKLSKEASASIVYYGQNSQHLQNLNSIALADEDNNYYIAAGELINYRPQGSIQIHRNFDDIVSIEWNPDLIIRSWIDKHSVPPVRAFDQKLITAMFSEGKASLMLFNTFYDEILTSHFLQAAKAYEGDLIFCEINKRNEHFDKFAEYMKLDVTIPRIVIVKGREQLKYLYAGSAQLASFESISEFIKVYQEKLLQEFKLVDKVDESSATQL